MKKIKIINICLVMLLIALVGMFTSGCGGGDSSSSSNPLLKAMVSGLKYNSPYPPPWGQDNDIALYTTDEGYYNVIVTDSTLIRADLGSGFVNCSIKCIKNGEDAEISFYKDKCNYKQIPHDVRPEIVIVFKECPIPCNTCGKCNAKNTSCNTCGGCGIVCSNCQGLNSNCSVCQGSGCNKYFE